MVQSRRKAAGRMSVNVKVALTFRRQRTIVVEKAGDREVEMYSCLY